MPRCGSQSKEHYELNRKGQFDGIRKCKGCKKRFTIRIGTILHKSPIPLRKWFIAIYIFSSHKKEISSLQLHRGLGVTPKTAWFMLQRIRANFDVKLFDKLTGIIQADERFIGGKTRIGTLIKRLKNHKEGLQKIKPLYLA